MKAKTVLALLSCLLAFSASTAEAACTKLNGGFAWTQHIYDNFFEGLGGGTCSAWSLTGAAQAVYDAADCPAGSGISGYQAAILDSGSGAVGSFYQDVDLTSVDPDSPIYFRFSVDRQGTLRTFDYLKVTIRDASDGSWLETVDTIRGTTSAATCGDFSYTLTGSYGGETIRVLFEGLVATGNAGDGFLVDFVQMNAYPPY